MRILNIFLIVVFLVGLFLSITLLPLSPTTAQSDTDATGEDPIAVVGQFATILAAPDSEAASLGRPDKARMTITGINSDGTYYRIDFEGQEGWVHENGVVRTEGDLTQVPVIGATLAEPEIGVIGRLMNVGGSVLSRPESGAERLGTAPGGENIPLAGINPSGVYYLVEFEGQTGWIRSSYFQRIEGDVSLLPVIGETAQSTPVPCTVSTDQAQTVRVRVGFGENRTSLTFLAADTVFDVKGQNTDAEDSIWYALGKEEAAPGKSVSGDVVWIAAEDATEAGDCDQVVLIDATGIIPIVQQSTLPESGSEETTTSTAPSITVVVSSQVVWVDTGISLTAGQSFSISATGLANLCGAGDNPNCVDDPQVNRMVGPDGNRFWEICEGQYDPCQLMPGTYGALVGRVGSGTAFHIGSGGDFVAGVNGVLQLGFNDHKFWDNTGAYTATITVR